MTSIALTIFFTHDFIITKFQKECEIRNYLLPKVKNEVIII